MNKVRRAAYVALAAVYLPSRNPELFPDDIGAYGLCHLCKYADWQGSDCYESQLDCRHPLADKVASDMFTEAWAWEPGHDCWGFRSLYDVDTVAEWVGQRLQGADVRLS